MLRHFFSFLVMLAVCWAAPTPGAARESGTSLPRVFGATFPSTFTIYALSPELLAGWNTPLRDYEIKYISEKYQRLPVLGGWYGQGFFPDREKLVASNLDEVLYVSGDREMGVDIAAQLKSIGLPFIAKKVLGMRDEITLFQELGEHYGMPERGNALAARLQKLLDMTLRMLEELPEKDRARVYVAQDVDGLGTVCDSSVRSELVNLAGGRNVHDCPQGVQESAMKVSFEQILLYDPDVVLILHPLFMQRYPGDPKWRNLRAAREGRVYFAPHEPFSWTDKPATFMRFIALPWLACKLHPDRCDADIPGETAAFMQLFFDLHLDSEATAKILKQ